MKLGLNPGTANSKAVFFTTVLFNFQLPPTSMRSALMPDMPFKTGCLHSKGPLKSFSRGVEGARQLQSGKTELLGSPPQTRNQKV